jgi:hypothetical protein
MWLPASCSKLSKAEAAHARKMESEEDTHSGEVPTPAPTTRVLKTVLDVVGDERTPYVPAHFDNRIRMKLELSEDAPCLC